MRFKSWLGFGGLAGLLLACDSTTDQPVGGTGGGQDGGGGALGGAGGTGGTAGGGNGGTAGTGGSGGTPQLGEFLWSKLITSPSYTTTTALTTDGSGNILVAGQWGGANGETGVALDLGFGPVLTVGNYDTYVVKLDGTGTPIWSQTFQGAGYAYPAGMVIDAGGNLLVAGDFTDSIDFGGGAATSAGDRDVFIVELDGDGQYVWGATFGHAAKSAPGRPAIAPNGDIVLVGAFEGTLDFGGSTLTAVAEQDMFVTRLDENGGHIWSQSFGGLDNQGGNAAVDGQGNIIVATTLRGTIDLGQGLLTAGGPGDLLVFKLDGSGNLIWAKQAGDLARQSVSDHVVDGAGNVFVTGRFSGAMDFGGGQLTEGDNDLYVVKLSSDGSHGWSKHFPGNIDAGGAGIALDGAGNVLVTGHVQGTIEFDGLELAGQDPDDVIVAKLAPDGKVLWASRNDDEGLQSGWDIAADNAGNVVICGGISATLTLGSDVHTPDYIDGFVAKLAP